MAIGLDLREETLAFNEGLRALIATLPEIENVPVEDTRLARYAEGGIFPPPVFLDEARWIDPSISPLYADLSGLPPALFTIGIALAANIAQVEFLRSAFSS